VSLGLDARLSSGQVSGYLLLAEVHDHGAQAAAQSRGPPPPGPGCGTQVRRASAVGALDPTAIRMPSVRLMPAIIAHVLARPNAARTAPADVGCLTRLAASSQCGMGGACPCRTTGRSAPGVRRTGS